MSTDIQQSIAALHAKLQQLQPAQVDAATRDQLMVLVADLGRLLGPDQVAEDHPLVDRLESVAVRFEAEHPSVGVAVRQLIDALAKAGI